MLLDLYANHQEQGINAEEAWRECFLPAPENRKMNKLQCGLRDPILWILCKGSQHREAAGKAPEREGLEDQPGKCGF